MTCKRARQLVSMELDDQLSAREIVLLRRHLAECSDCSAFGNDLRRMVAASRELHRETAPDGFLLAVNRRILAAGEGDAKTPRSRMHSPLPWIAPLLTTRQARLIAVAIASLALVVMGVQYRRSLAVDRAEAARLMDAATSEEIALAAYSPLDDISVIPMVGAAGMETEARDDD